MAGGGENSRELDQTPTWAVASVCAIIVVISILLEQGLHYIGEWLTEKRKKALFEALAKVKADHIAKICIPEKAASTMLPCKLRNEADEGDQLDGSRRSRLLGTLAANYSSRRILSAQPNPCSKGKVPFVSVHSMHQLHIFIFFLALVHVAYSAITMALGRAKIRRWKEWEKETQTDDYDFPNDPSRLRFALDTTFVRQHTSFWNRLPIFLYVGSFFHQFFRSVRKTDYLAMRHGFINVHLAPGSKFNFQKYILRSLEDDFKIVVGISPLLWVSAVLFLLLNVHGWHELFWATLLPPVIILAVGTKLQAIIATMAVEIQERHQVIQGIPVVHLDNRHFWFGRPQLVLSLIHFSLFQNAFQITYFFWIWYDFGLRSCFHENLGLTIGRVCIGAAVQFVCSYITLPLYALVSQMGSHMKRSIFDEQTSLALKKWHQAVKRKHKTSRLQSPSVSPSTSTMASPNASSRIHQFVRSRTLGINSRVTRNHSRLSYFSDPEISDQEAENMSSPSSATNLIPSFKHNREVGVDEKIEHCLNLEGHGDEEFTFVNHPLENGENQKPPI
ncbi:uncharacterized protein A4U43_C10F17950 [Asparagus officinalis]|uniref:MLO-like protein n=1 Tax=Asparagus officinalis TaxID=4686 RepID=A0A5P1E3L5_ASPOF|nr:uncharacterized protein A4U43_C10F17950 [Asparagus officinalis]